MLYVETHWILSCVLHEDADAPSLLEQAGSSLHICMPAFCVAEAIARFRTLEKNAKSFRDRLAESRREAHRRDIDISKRLAYALETAIQEQDFLIGQLPAEFGTFMEQLFASAIEQLPVGHETVHRANGYVETLKMSRGDALVLATVVQHASAHQDAKHAFLSGNKDDFGRKSPGGGELRRANIEFFSRTSAATGWMTANTARPPRTLGE